MRVSCRVGVRTKAAPPVSRSRTSSRFQPDASMARNSSTALRTARGSRALLMRTGPASPRRRNCRRSSFDSCWSAARLPAAGADAGLQHRPPVTIETVLQLPAADGACTRAKGPSAATMGNSIAAPRGRRSARKASKAR